MIKIFSVRGLVLGLVAWLLPSIALAADGFEVLQWGNIQPLGESTDVVAADWVKKGRVPVNDEWVFVYDPEFYFHLTGSLSGPNRVPEFADKGFVVVAAAGDPGGYYRSKPSWFDFTAFSSSYDAQTPELELAVTHKTTFVPTVRGFQSYIVYYNYKQVPEPSELVVYDSDRFVWPRTISGLTFGANNFLLTGDGQQSKTTFRTDSPNAAAGPTAMEIKTSQDSGTGTHWKLMLFANGNAASFNGIDLRDYDKLVFEAKASRNLTLLGAVGTGDDSGHRSLPPMALTTSYQHFELDLSGIDRSDINTLLWVYLHKSVNPFDFSGVSVFLDNVKLTKNKRFVTKEKTYTLGSHTTDQGAPANTEVRFDSATSYLTPFPGTGTPPQSWVVDLAQAHTHYGDVLLHTATLGGLYVQECVSKEWVNINDTALAPALPPLVLNGNQYVLNHFFSKTKTNVLLDERYSCAQSANSYVDVLYQGASKRVLSAGKVNFAFVVEHR
jgi:hypothetical protein